MPSILFVCTANRFRSPLAAAFLRKELNQKGLSEYCHVASAGTWARSGQPVMPGLVETARKFGVDLSEHRSRRVSGSLLSKYDLIVVMQASHREALVAEDPSLQNKVFLLSEIVEYRHYDIPDPFGSGQNALETVSELDDLIRQGADSLCSRAVDLNAMRCAQPN
jgi:protein-tyrosine phosphatase